jgi:Protein of unknown function (DUF1592)/Protein of unknown function (DUF1588)/Protein of unknown function (DUF1587)/Protein of unknown function (DUF1585)/Protein of unknown function (DUF1595)/Ca-dependent carbohydrate-binding module xylan-binding/Planctomycete cytochrome C
MRRVFIVGVLVAGLVAAAWAYQRRQSTAVAYRLPTVDPTRAESGLHREVLPVLNRYCWDCHGDGISKGDVALDRFTNATAVLSDRKLWERVLHTIASGDMPPPKKSQPSPAERQQVVRWLESTLFPVDPERPDPGRVTLRRLNRTEYDYTIRDLVGVSFQPAADFPEDDVGYGFDNIGDVLSLPPLLLEKYLAAAEAILDEAIVDGPRPTPVRKIEAAKFSGGNDVGPIRGLSSNGELTANFRVVHPGRYRVTIRAYGDQAGPDPVRMALRVNGADVRRFDVKAKSENPGHYETDLPLDAAGDQHLAVAFLNDFFQEKYVERKRGEKPPVREKVSEDRNFWLNELTVTGPMDVQLPPPEFHQRLFGNRKPESGDEIHEARRILGDFAGKAWRRPVTPSELDRLLTLYRQSRKQGDRVESAVKQVLTAVLVSPHFLFRGELQPEPNNPASIHRVGEYALASRLSYFLWSSLPDDTLFQLAGEGRLRRNLDAQVRRMLRDPKARALTESFAGQWLGLRTLGILEPDRGKFPAFNEDLRSSMRDETERFFSYVVSEDRPVMDFLLGDYTFLNGTLGRHYGIAGPDGDAFVKVSLAGTPRQGLLTQGSILTLTSNPTRTSPVKRGKWVLENLLATPPPPPPPNVPELEAGEKLQGTLRQRMEMHRENAMCASCHARMDPIGFALEHFDGVGAWREMDGTEPIEAAGELNSGEKFADHRELNRVLSTHRRGDFLRCLSEKMLTYALGRGLEYYDRPAVQKIVRDLESGDGRFSTLVLGVVHSAPFQLRRGEGDPTRVATR